MPYQIKKIKVYPKEPINWNNGVYLGVSMSNQIFHTKDSLNEILSLIFKHLDTLTILVGDYLNRFNEQVFNNKDERTAIQISLKRGEEIIEILNHSTAFTLSPRKLIFIRTQEFLSRPSFAEKNNRFKTAYKLNSDFHQLVNYTVNVFLRRQVGFKVPLNQAEELCREYLFEELTIFELLAEDNLKVNIYPGNQLPIIKEIVAGRLPSVSKSLEEIQAIEIKFRPIK